MRDIQELHQMQALPLSLKVSLTRARIRQWVQAYGEDGVYISFSGGKDSTVLLHIARQEYPNMNAIFVDTGLEYPEIRAFVKTFDNITWLKPRKTFKQVVLENGYPFISKEVTERVYFGQKYLQKHDSERHGEKSDKELLIAFAKSGGAGTYKIRELCGLMKKPDGSKSEFNYSKYIWMASAPFLFSHKCCDIMKKQPYTKYERETERHGMTAQMASESRLRTLQWLKNGCNAFDAKKPVSNPMAFWTEQDVLLYISEHDLPLCSVYGEIVRDYEADGQLEGQMSLQDLDESLGIFDIGRPTLKTTGCSRTGCMFCGFGCQFSGSQDRFEKMKETHPKQYKYIMKPVSEGGLGYKEVIDWINEHGDLNIRY